MLWRERAIKMRLRSYAWLMTFAACTGRHGAIAKEVFEEWLTRTPDVPLASTADIHRMFISSDGVFVQCFEEDFTPKAVCGFLKGALKIPGSKVSNPSSGNWAIGHEKTALP